LLAGVRATEPIVLAQVNLTINEFCAAFNCGRTKAYELIGTGEVEAIKLGKKTLIPYAELERLQARLPRMRPNPGTAPQHRYPKASFELPDVQQEASVSPPQTVKPPTPAPLISLVPDNTS
jgi:excisionase family DNA binding protein